MSGTTHIGGGRPAGDVSFNYTPLVDVTFNLILYFVLTSTIQTAAMAMVYPPAVLESQSKGRDVVAGGEQSVIINIVSKKFGDGKDDSPLSAEAERYEVGGTPIRIGDVDALEKLLKNRQEAIKNSPVFKDFYLEVRADRRVSYANIEPVLLAAARAKIEKMNITALMKD